MTTHNPVVEALDEVCIAKPLPAHPHLKRYFYISTALGEKLAEALAIAQAQQKFIEAYAKHCYIKDIIKQENRKPTSALVLEIDFCNSDFEVAAAWQELQQLMKQEG